MSNLSDAVSEANLFGGGNYSFVPDRFCTPNSAIYFNKGYLQVPEGIYFSGDFTVTAWIYLKSYQYFSRIFDFGNGKNNDNVYFSFIRINSNMKASIWRKNSSVRKLNTSPIINLNEWYFISFVLNRTTSNIYVNGNQVATGSFIIPNNITRTRNYIGKSNWAADSNADAIYDEIKIYQVALTSSQIMNEYMNEYITSHMTSYFDETFYLKCLASQLSNDVRYLLI